MKNEYYATQRSDYATVTGAKFEHGKIQVDLCRNDMTFSKTYEQVVNALWDGRLPLDASIGLRSHAQWLHRFKYGIRLKVDDRPRSVPSATIALGRYGDIVSFPNGELFLSWYPVCLAGASQDLHLPNWPQKPTQMRSREMFEKSYEALAAICPALDMIDRNKIRDVEVRGGVIAARGATDIDDMNSELHERFNIGTISVDGYHSIDIGKYTTVPLLAIEVCDRICDSQPATSPYSESVHGDSRHLLIDT